MKKSISVLTLIFTLAFGGALLTVSANVGQQQTETMTGGTMKPNGDTMMSVKKTAKTKAKRKTVKKTSAKSKSKKMRLKRKSAVKKMSGDTMKSDTMMNSDTMMKKP